MCSRWRGAGAVVDVQRPLLQRALAFGFVPVVELAAHGWRMTRPLTKLPACTLYCALLNTVSRFESCGPSTTVVRCPCVGSECGQLVVVWTSRCRGQVFDSLHADSACSLTFAPAAASGQQYSIFVSLVGGVTNCVSAVDVTAIEWNDGLNVARLRVSVCPPSLCVLNR